ncbi:MAG: hypothetical protein K2Y37_02530 [Pirellulales bacterium]|nr:hypothetical protein [Pirellulales bacterium]
MSWKIIVPASVVLLSLGLGLYWWRGGAEAADPAVERVVAMQAQIMPAEGPRPSVDQQVKAMTEMGKSMRELSPEQRQQVFERSGFRERIRRDLDAYFELPVEKRKAFLDERIDEMERMRKVFEKMREQNEKNGGAAGSGGGPGGRQGGGPSGGPGAGPPGPPPSDAGPRPGGPGFGSPGSTRHERMRGMLDSTTPEERAKGAEFFRDLMKRREERGLPAFPGRP